MEMSNETKRELLASCTEDELKAAIDAMTQTWAEKHADLLGDTCTSDCAHFAINKLDSYGDHRVSININGKYYWKAQDVRELRDRLTDLLEVM